MGDAFDMVLTVGTAGAAGWLYANWKNVGAEVGILAGELAWMLRQSGGDHHARERMDRHGRGRARLDGGH